MNIDHLDGGKLFESAPRSQSWRQRDLQTVGQERYENMSFDSAVFLMEDRANRQIAFQILECLFDGNELGIVLPQQRGIVLGEVGPQQIASFAPPDPPQLLAVEGV